MICFRLSGEKECQTFLCIKACNKSFFGKWGGLLLGLFEGLAKNLLWGYFFWGGLLLGLLLGYFFTFGGVLGLVLSYFFTFGPQKVKKKVPKKVPRTLLIICKTDLQTNPKNRSWCFSGGTTNF